jgi:flagellar basal-body rod modification protein FlgD
MNTNLSALMSAQTITNNLQAATLLGKEVQAQNDTTQVQKQGGATPFNYSLATDSATVQIDVLDQSGNTVRTIQAGAQKAGSQNLAWNGKDMQGKALPEGMYHFKVTAQDKAGHPVAVDASLKGTVDEVAYDGKQPYLVVGGNRVALTAITDVKQSK